MTVWGRARRNNSEPLNPYESLDGQGTRHEAGWWEVYLIKYILEHFIDGTTPIVKDVIYFDSSDVDWYDHKVMVREADSSLAFSWEDNVHLMFFNSRSIWDLKLDRVYLIIRGELPPILGLRVLLLPTMWVTINWRYSNVDCIHIFIVFPLWLEGRILLNISLFNCSLTYCTSTLPGSTVLSRLSNDDTHLRSDYTGGTRSVSHSIRTPFVLIER